MLCDLTTHVVGIDTHADTHTLAVVDSKTGGVLETGTFRADLDGYAAMVDVVDHYCGPAERCWAMEGTGSYGAGLCTFLNSRQEWVIEVERPKRIKARNGQKNDEIDAVRAARDALSREHFGAPKIRGDQEALRTVMTARELCVNTRTSYVNQLKALIVTAPEPLRNRLRHLSTSAALCRVVKTMKMPKNVDVEYLQTLKVLKNLVKTIGQFDCQIRDYDKTIAEFTQELCPELLEETGVGPWTAARILLAWSHAGRCRDEAAFAMLGGIAPLEASSGKTARHRLNRGGDRQLNRAIHVVVMSRAKIDEPTKVFIQSQLTKGKSKRETYRLLGRYVIRHLYRVLESHHPRADQSAIAA